MEHETQPGMIAILDIQAGAGGAHYETHGSFESDPH